MLELLGTFILVAVVATVVAQWIPSNWGLDPAEKIGLGGLLGLALVGWTSFFFIWWDVSWAGVPLVLLTLCLIYQYRIKQRPHEIWRFKRPSLTADFYIIPLTLALIVACLAALAPSTTMDWDSLAYHLAVPKLWIEAGKMTYIPFIHHSNFPFLIDNLFVIGLQKGETAAKAFTAAGFGLGMLWVFGISRRWWGRGPAIWAALLFAGVPVILWESGTAYIDVIHGLFAAGGAAYALDALQKAQKGESCRSSILLVALLLGAAISSKFTGLQTWAVVGLVLLVGVAILTPKERRPRLIGATLAAGALALAIGSPWLIRNVLNTGNPVYPFFYERLGGRDWDQRRADIYKNEQQTFGIGRTETGRDWSQWPHAVLGLAYQPGRYVNPGQTQGMGYPMGAVGFAVVGVLVLAALGRRKGDVRVAGALAIVGLSLVIWFALSQQSRYITSFVPLVALLVGSISAKSFKNLAMGAIGVQFAFTIIQHWKTISQDQMQVVTGRVSREDYLKATVGFYPASQAINQELKSTDKVALYDEVFGYFLDVPYVWANPGHSTRIPYDDMQSGQDFARILNEQGFSHVYVNLQWQDPAFAQRWLGAMGVNGEVVPLPKDERTSLLENWEVKWKVLLAESAASGELTEVKRFPRGILFKVNPR